MLMYYGRVWFIVWTVIAVVVGIVHPPAFGYIEEIALLGGIAWLVGWYRTRKTRT